MNHELKKPLENEDHHGGRGNRRTGAAVLPVLEVFEF
jgi:hypothetical protein